MQQRPTKAWANDWRTRLHAPESIRQLRKRSTTVECGTGHRGEREVAAVGGETVQAAAFWCRADLIDRAVVSRTCVPACSALHSPRIPSLPAVSPSGARPHQAPDPPSVPCQLASLHGYSGSMGNARETATRSARDRRSIDGAVRDVECVSRSVEDLIGPLNEIEQKYAPRQLWVSGDPSIFADGCIAVGGRITPPFPCGSLEDSPAGDRTGAAERHCTQRTGAGRRHSRPYRRPYSAAAARSPCLVRHSIK